MDWWLYFVIGLVSGMLVAAVIAYFVDKSRLTVSGALKLDLLNDEADAVPISLELYEKLDDVRVKKVIFLEVHNSQ